MTILVDTSVWSLALRRDVPSDGVEVDALRQALSAGSLVVTTGLILQELLQGFTGPHARADILERFRTLPIVSPDRVDHIEAAGLRNQCRRAGVQIGTIDAVIAQLCIRHALTLLTADQHFRHMAKHVPLKLLT